MKLKLFEQDLTRTFTNLLHTDNTAQESLKDTKQSSNAAHP